MQTEEDIMNDMENDLLSKEAEDNFLEQFEKELQNEKSSLEEEKTDDFFNSLDQIVDGSKARGGHERRMRYAVLFAASIYGRQRNPVWK